MEKSTNAERYLFPIPVEQTKAVAEKHIRKIPSVNKLAEMMGHSRSNFCIGVKEHYGMTPGELIRNIRFKKVKELIIKYPYETSRAIAERAGLKGEGEKTMYKFLSTHWDTNFTELRKKLLFGENGRGS